MTTVPLILNEEDCERGGKLDSDNEESIENDFRYRNNVLNATKEVRIAFIRKVYGLLSTQILLTVFVSAVIVTSSNAKLFVQQKWVIIIIILRKEVPQIIS